MRSRFFDGTKIMVPFAMVLLMLVGGVFTLLYIREQAQHEKSLHDYAHETANNVLAVRMLFAENQKKINSDSQGRYEFKNLNPSAAANDFIAKTKGQTGKKIKQTSFLYRKAEDAPDEWERKALAGFEANRSLTEISEIVTTENAPVYRFAVPLYIEPSCLPCHGEPKGLPDISGYPREGYRLGDLRGAITVTLPLTDYYAARNNRIFLFISLVAGIVLLVLLVERRVVDSLQRIANTDRLTQVYNRNALYERLRQEITQATTHRMPLSVIMFDLDHFKRVNDIYGHLAGDEVLRKTASTAKGALRRGDILARFGGEEFVIVSPNAEQSGALALAERLRQAVEVTDFKYKDIIIKITISAGVATLSQQAGQDIAAVRDALLDQADKALYRAKNNGRNRVEAYLKED